MIAGTAATAGMPEAAPFFSAARLLSRPLSFAPAAGAVFPPLRRLLRGRARDPGTRVEDDDCLSVAHVSRARCHRLAPSRRLDCRVAASLTITRRHDRQQALCDARTARRVADQDTIVETRVAVDAANGCATTVSMKRICAGRRHATAVTTMSIFPAPRTVLCTQEASSRYAIGTDT